MPRTTDKPLINHHPIGMEIDCVDDASLISQRCSDATMNISYLTELAESTYVAGAQFIEAGIKIKTTKKETEVYRSETL